MRFLTVLTMLGGLAWHGAALANEKAKETPAAQKAQVKPTNDAKTKPKADKKADKKATVPAKAKKAEGETKKPAAKMEAAAKAASPSISPMIEALRHAEADKWPQARQAAEASGQALPLKLVRWLEALEPNSGASFKEITELLAESPDWPQRNIMLRRAEEAITLSTPPDQILAWFDANKPISADGGMAYGAALLSAGRNDEAKEILRQTWINRDFGILQERSFLSRHRELLSQADHQARMNRLLWDEQKEAAERMMLFLEGPARELAHARLMLIRGMGTPTAAAERVPEHLRQDPGLLFNSVRWYRRKEMYEEAIRLARNAPEQLDRPDIWWSERAILARKALQLGFISDAYEIAAKHRLTDAINIAEAEWMAGWVALRFLSDKEAAHRHFTQMAEKAQSAPGKAKAAYWMGRAAEALGKKDAAQAAYKQAALFPTSYYGQLGAEQLGPDQGWLLGPDPLPSDEEKARFAASEVARATDLLIQAGTISLARPFLARLLESAETPGMKALAIAKAQNAGRIEVTVSLARRADRSGVTLAEAGWPIPPYPIPEFGPEKALILALIRQESGFHSEAVSSAGARGLMQLMPATAKRVAQSIKEKYSPAQLTADPGFNILLGTTYLTGLLDDFKGSYIMALAGYNAGPHRVTRWVREFGDPREAETDVIDWVEQIPFSETRGYVQRVMESLQIYRKRLGMQSATVALLPDLKRKVPEGSGIAASGADQRP